MKKDYTVKICLLISIISHTVFFTALLLKDTTNLLPKKQQQKQIYLKQNNEDTIELLSYHSTPETLSKADILSLAKVRASLDKKESVAPYTNSIWDNTFEDVRIKKAIPTQFTHLENLNIDTDTRINILNKKITPNISIVTFKSEVTFPKYKKSVWISNPLLNYKNNSLLDLGMEKTKGVLLIDSKGMIKNIMINKTSGDIPLEKLIKIIQKGQISSTAPITPQWINFEII